MIQTVIFHLTDSVAQMSLYSMYQWFLLSFLHFLEKEFLLNLVYFMMSKSFKRMRLSLTTSIKKWTLEVFWDNLQEYLNVKKDRLIFLKSKFEDLMNSLRINQRWKQKWRSILFVSKKSKLKLKSNWFGTNILFIFTMRRNVKKITIWWNKLDSLLTETVLMIVKKSISIKQSWIPLRLNYRFEMFCIIISTRVLMRQEILHILKSMRKY